MTKFLNKIGDRINPIVVKETRQAVSSRFVAWSLILFLAVELLAMTIYLLNESAAADSNMQDMRLGRNVFLFLQGILMVSCMILIPALTGGRLAGERSDVNVDLLFISSLSPRAIMAGKLYAATALALLLFSACAPFMTFSYMLRGLDIPTIFVVLASDFITVLFGTMFALLIAAIPAPRGLRILMGVGGVITMGYLIVGAQAMHTSFLEFGMGLDLQSRDFWLSFCGLAATMLGVIGLMFFWATALISPPASNRAFLVRLYTLAFWLYGAIACAIWSRIVNAAPPVYIWGLLGTILFSLQILISCTERDQWGPRVTRKIPRSKLLRIPAFLFYSGAAGGMLFGVLGCAASMSGMYLWCEVFADKLSLRQPEEGFLTFTMMLAAYTYCFCMSAVAFRRMLNGTAFNHSMTWIIALILFGLGSIFPWVLREIVTPSGPRYRNSDDYVWMFVTSPVTMMTDAVWHRESTHVIALTTVFLVIWGAAITAINFRWLLDQVMRFHPPSPRIDKTAPDGAI